MARLSALQTDHTPAEVDLLPREAEDLTQAHSGLHRRGDDQRRSRRLRPLGRRGSRAGCPAPPGTGRAPRGSSLVSITYGRQPTTTGNSAARTDSSRATAPQPPISQPSRTLGALACLRVAPGKHHRSLRQPHRVPVRAGACIVRDFCDRDESGVVTHRSTTNCCDYSKSDIATRKIGVTTELSKPMPNSQIWVVIEKYADWVGTSAIRQRRCRPTRTGPRPNAFSS